MAFSLQDHFTNLPDDDGEAYGFIKWNEYADWDRYDFEETYDGLGDRLDETLDEFNDETFGTSGADVGKRPFLVCCVLTICTGRDFDFFGKTAKIADVMEEEQMTYARSHTMQKPPPTQAARQAEIQQQQQQQNYVRQLQRQSAPPPPRTVLIPPN